MSWRIAAEDNWPSVHRDTLFKVNKQLFKAAEHLYPISAESMKSRRMMLMVSRSVILTQCKVFA